LRGDERRSLYDNSTARLPGEDGILRAKFTWPEMVDQCHSPP